MRANKEGLIAFRVTSAQKDAFEAMAEAKGERMSEILRRFVERELRKISKDPAG
jgi:hypothetical protein